MAGSVDVNVIAARDDDEPTLDQSADTSSRCSLWEVEIVPDEGVILSHVAFDVAVNANVLGPPAETSMNREPMGI